MAFGLSIADTLLRYRYDSGGFGGLDLSRDCEDPRTPFSGGDKFSAGREVAKTDDGFSFLEVQRELRESELKSLRSSTENAVSPTGFWNVGCTVFEVDRLVVEHHFADWLWDGRIRWYPIVSKSLGRGFYELEHPKWVFPADGRSVLEPSDISSVEGNLLANARVVGEVASDLEQKRNDIVGDVENTLHVRAELKKTRERPPSRRRRWMNTCNARC
jgi:hypothetical protein